MVSRFLNPISCDLVAVFHPTPADNDGKMREVAACYRSSAGRKAECGVCGPCVASFRLNKGQGTLTT